MGGFFTSKLHRARHSGGKANRTSLRATICLRITSNKIKYFVRENPKKKAKKHTIEICSRKNIAVQH